MIENIVIIEDEKPAARRLVRMLQKENLSVETILSSVKTAINWFLNNEQPQLIFADIHLTDGLSFEIFEQISIKSPIIFTTAYDQYAIKAFKVNSIDYLLKPIKQEDLQNALKKYRSNHKELSNNIKNLLESIEKPNNYKQRFIVKYGTHLQSIHISEIDYFYSQNKITFLVTENEEEFILDYSLDKLEKLLMPTMFIRVNRQFIVSHKAIKDIINYNNSRLKIILNSNNLKETIISRERVKKFLNWLST